MLDMIPNPVPLSILAVTVVMSIIAFKHKHLMQQWLLTPYNISRSGSYRTFITSGFIHADYQHLFFNMFTFYFFAFPLEEIMGPAKFTILYFASMIIANIPTYLKNKENPRYASLGASGAVSGVVFGYILYEPLSRIYIMFIPLGIPAFIYAFLYLAYCVHAARRQADNINHSAHFWGSLTGFIITVAFNPDVINRFIERIQSFL
ncbi:MAG: rhomboid family intramembrane serine protease [Spirochaetes bacterium]|nr:rhomboid family intramembrane serine protease [Spirochaetota bacterium]